MNNLLEKISRSERSYLALIILAVIVTTTLPFLFGYLAAPAGTSYNGIHSLSPGDIPVYYSYISQVAAGNFLTKDLFTAEAQTLGTFNVWWSLVGVVTAIFHLPVAFSFQVFRILMIPVFILVMYLFLVYLFDEVKIRKLSLFFILFSSGLGFYFALPYSAVDLSEAHRYAWPIDLWLTEANTFNTLFQTSHFIASITLTLLIFLLFALAFEKNKISYAFWAGILSLIYFNFHPYYVPVIFGTAGLMLFIKMIQANKFLWRHSGYVILAFLLSAPSVIYHFYLIASSTVIATRASQNITLTPRATFMLIGYGFLWVFGAMGLYFWAKNKQKNQRLWLIVSWLAINLFLIIFQFPFQSRYTQGLHIILSIFTVLALHQLFYILKNKLKPKFFELFVNNQALLAIGFVLIFGMSTFYSVLRDFYILFYGSPATKEKLFINQDVEAAGRWLASQPKNGSVLAADIPSKFITSWARQQVFAGHPHETLNYYAKFPKVIWFFGSQKDLAAKKEFLIKENISFIFYSDYEKELGSFDPAQVSYLKRVFDSPEAQIYQLIN